MKLVAGTALKRMKPAAGKAFALNDAQLKALQACTLDLLADLVALCDANGLHYTLGGGTALGAIRHKGFIPWDDDADFNMPRADLDKLVDIILRDKADELDVLAPAITHDYGLPFVQVRRRGTQAVKQEDFCKASSGVCVDIFPIENMYENPIRRTLHGLRCLAMGLALSCKRTYDHLDLFMEIAQGNPELASSFSAKARIGRLLSFRSLDSWCRAVDRCYSSCRDESTPVVGIPSGRAHFFGELYAADTFFPAVTADFEGHAFNVPGNWDAYLSALYGDYRKIPDEADREHHWYIRLELPSRPV